MINDPTNRKKIKQQINTMTKLVDIYKSLFEQLMIKDALLIKHLSQKKTRELNPEYIELCKILQSILVGILYMNKLNKNSNKTQLKRDKVSMTKNKREHGSENIFSKTVIIDNPLYPYQITNHNAQKIKTIENNLSYVSNDSNDSNSTNILNDYGFSSDILIWLILLLIVGVIIYVVSSNKK